MRLDRKAWEGGGQGVDTWLIRDVAGIGDNFDRSHLSFVDDGGRRQLLRSVFRFPRSLYISTTRQRHAPKQLRNQRTNLLDRMTGKTRPRNQSLGANLQVHPTSERTRGNL